MGGARNWMLRVGLIAPSDGSDPYRHRRGEPRGFALFWTAFLVLGTMACFAAYGVGRGITPHGYVNAARSLTAVLGLGVGVLWPVFRLSQAPAKGGGIAVVSRDLVIVLLPLQAVLWPQALVAKWPIEVISAVAAVLGAWAAIIGAVIAISLGSAVPRRSEAKDRLGEATGRVISQRGLTMLLILLIVFAGPTYWWIEPILSGGSAHASFWSRMASPVTAPLELTRERLWTGHAAQITGNHWRAISLTLVFAGVSWVVAATTVRSPDKR